MFCPNCGAQVEDGTAFCSNCGAKIEKYKNDCRNCSSGDCSYHCCKTGSRIIWRF